MNKLDNSPTITVIRIKTCSQGITYNTLMLINVAHEFCCTAHELPAPTRNLLMDAAGSYRIPVQIHNYIIN